MSKVGNGPTSRTRRKRPNAVGGCTAGQMLRHIQAGNPDPAVGHTIVNIDAVRLAKIIPPIDTRGKHDVGDGTAAFLPELRGQHRLH